MKHGDMMLNGSVLVLSVLTAGRVKTYEQLSDLEQQLWCEKQAFRLTSTAPEQLYETRSGLHPEFGQITTIGLGFLSVRGNSIKDLSPRILQAEDERSLLTQFLEALPEEDGRARPRYSLCAHNGLGFGFLFLYRRLLAQGLALPAVLQLRGRKPWELTHLEDTLAWWRIGGWGSQPPTSLRLLAHGLQLTVPGVLFECADAAACHAAHHNENAELLHRYAEAELHTTAAVYARLRDIDWQGGENTDAPSV